jgi:hypothetical protein
VEYLEPVLRTFSQVEKEILGSASQETGEVDAADVSRLLLHDFDLVTVALESFCEEGLAEPVSGTLYRLTQRGQAAYKAYDEHLHAAEKRRLSSSWQRPAA